MRAHHNIKFPGWNHVVIYNDVPEPAPGQSENEEEEVADDDPPDDDVHDDDVIDEDEMKVEEGEG